MTKVGKGDTVLDIGCGTGQTLPFIEERNGPGGKLIGLDYTPAMLEYWPEAEDANTPEPEEVEK